VKKEIATVGGVNKKRPKHAERKRRTWQSRATTFTSRWNQRKVVGAPPNAEVSLGTVDNSALRAPETQEVVEVESGCEEARQRYGRD
jgi:hypothetical protein